MDTPNGRTQTTGAAGTRRPDTDGAGATELPTRHGIDRCQAVELVSEQSKPGDPLLVQGQESTVCRRRPGGQLGALAISNRSSRQESRRTDDGRGPGYFEQCR